MTQQPGHIPDLSGRPFSLDAERLMNLPAATVYRAWTAKWDQWFAVPGSLVLSGGDAPLFFFVTGFDGRFHPHYGRYLQREQDRLVVLTWMTAGTRGAETVLTIRINAQGNRTLLQLTHAGFPDEESKEQHAQAWPLVLEQLERKMSTATS